MKTPPPKTNDSKDQEGFIRVVYLFGYFLQSASNANSYCILSPFAAQKTRLLGHVGSKFQGILALLGPQHEIIQKKKLFVCVLSLLMCLFQILFHFIFRSFLKNFPISFLQNLFSWLLCFHLSYFFVQNS